MSVQTRLLLTFCLAITFLFSQQSIAQNYWNDISKKSVSLQNAERQIIPNAFRVSELNLKALKKQMLEAPMRFTDAVQTEIVMITLPMPDGSFEQFRLVETPVMHPNLAAKYPQIKSWAGIGIQDPTAYLRCDVSQKGFRAMIRSARRNTIFIDPYAKGDTKNYIIYHKKDFVKTGVNDLTCEVENPDFIQNISKGDATEILKKKPKNQNVPPVLKTASDCQLRTYQLALACTGEYATFHGGNVPDVMAEYVTAINRVSGIYEIDATISMELIENTDELIFLNAATDPYTNNNGGTMLNQNQTTCNNIIGAANYDIGHVFSTGGGGIAQLGVPCGGSKARGVTGLGNPVNDPFYVDYVAHEIGHQFGANHTQNNSCNRNGSTAMEPGSASTIMGYAGICNPNVQNFSDDHFHAVSLDEIDNYVTFGNGNGCPTTVASGNNAPTVSIENDDFVLPISTSFFLTAVGEDLDEDNVLTYCWEQMNNQVANMPPEPTNTGGPAFRSISPHESPTRYFPNLEAIINNQSPTWEVLPSVSRTMDFRVTVRDNFLGAGCQAELDVDLEFVASAGPFLVTNPNSNLTWLVGENQTVTWDVANTDAAPVSCDLVDILLSTDGGFTYPIVLASGVANNGELSIQVPNNITSTARVKVVCASSIFFDISNQNFSIEVPPAPTFLMSVNPNNATVCQNETASFDIDMSILLGFDEEITLTTTDLPAGAIANFSANPVTPPAGSTLTIGNLTEVAGGTYEITIQATSASVDRSVDITLTVFENISGTANLLLPEDGNVGEIQNPQFSWDAVDNADSYYIEIATNPSLAAGSIVESATVSDNSYQAQNANASGAIYYWRVSPRNPCSDGEFSEIFAFQTAPTGCTTYSGNELPVSIPDDEVGIWTSTINVENDATINDLNLFLSINHTWIGDLIVTLTSPNGTISTLIDQPGLPGSDFGCDSDNVLVLFDDAAANSAADLEATCENDPAIGGTFQAIDLFSGFNGESSMGEWILSVEDVFDQDGGTVEIFDLEICEDVVVLDLNLLENQVLTVPNAGTEDINNTHLNVEGIDTENITFIMLSPTTNGIVSLNGTALMIGDTFTQEDINNGNLTYEHDGYNTSIDSFIFDVINNSNGWLHDQIFEIVILQNTLSANAELTNSISCFNENNGEITATANGGTAPLMYSINGTDYQDMPVFTGISAGTYTVTVMDSNNFTISSNEVEVINPPTLTLTASVDTDEVTANAAGGTGDLTYSINGTDFQNGNIFSGLENGIYTIWVMDENGCLKETTAVIAVNTILANATLISEISCAEANDASIEVFVGGGAMPFQYSLDGMTFVNENIFNNLSPGTYLITVLDNDGFSATTNEITIEAPLALSGNSAVDGYEITINAAGGTGNLSYSLNGVDFQSENIFSNNPSGDYQITVQDENGCQTTIDAVIDVAALGANPEILNQILCFDYTTGSIIVAGSGGVPPYEYSLNGVDFQMNANFEILAAGTYVFTIKDSGGFTYTTDPIILENPEMLSANANVNGYNIEVSAMGGTGDVQYSLDGINFQNEPIFEHPGNGIYDVIIQDVNGCQTTVSVELDIADLNSEGVLENHITCFDNNNGGIFAIATGGIAPYQYSIDGVNFQSESFFGGLSGGIYTITILDAGNVLVQTNEIEVINPPAINVSATSFGFEITVDANGGTGNLQYSLNGNDFQTENVLTSTMNGIQTVFVQDENGCITTENVLINAIIDVEFEVIPVSCNGMADGSISVTEVTGGFAPYLYSINGGDFDNETTWGNLIAGNYEIVVQDSEGFEFVLADVLIEDVPMLVLETMLDENNLTINVDGGTEPYLYSIDGGETFVSTNVFTGLPNGTFDIIVTDNQDCIIEESVVINAVFDLSEDLFFAILPNPSNGIFVLKMNQLTENQLFAKVFDVAGKLVFDQIWTKNGMTFEQTLDLQNMPEGVYQLVVDDGMMIGVKRLVILR